MVTDRDICMAAYTRDLPLSQMSVGSACSNGLIAVLEGDSVEAAERLMQVHRVRRLPVVDADHRPIGMLSSPTSCVARASTIATATWPRRGGRDARSHCDAALGGAGGVTTSAVDRAGRRRRSATGNGVSLRRARRLSRGGDRLGSTAQEDPSGESDGADWGMRGASLHPASATQQVK